MSLATLPSDALISVLSRVPAGDHDSLWQTCKSIRAALKSNDYASERAASGWAEVSARLVTKEEDYDEMHPDGMDLYGDDDELEGEARRRKLDEERERCLEENYSDLGRLDESYRYHDISVEIKVDGIKAGSVKLVLIPRGPRYPFHEAADAHSRELQQAGWSLCDRSGRPKVRSIKAADVNGNAKTGGFLHVESVRIGRQSYKPSVNTTNVVASALRAALLLPELRGMWTLATAMTDADVYMPKKDRNRWDEIRNFEWHHEGKEEDAGVTASREEEKTVLRAKMQECLYLDARTFVRVGYKQIPEMMEAGRLQQPWLFAFPEFVEQPMLSHDEALAIDMFVRPELPPDPIGADKELFDLVKDAANGHLQSKSRLPGLREQMKKEWDLEEASIAQFREMEDEINQMVQLFEANGQSGSPALETMKSKIATMRESNGVGDMLRKHENGTFEQCFQAKKRELEVDNAREIEEFKRKAGALVNNREASVRKSHGLHCCARLRCTEHFDFLRSLIPAHERKKAINEWDLNGCTPLGCVLLGTPEMKDADDCFQFAEYLLELGADKDIVDPYGRTPLGQYRNLAQGRNNFMSVFLSQQSGASSWVDIDGRFEALLKPIRGETDADRDAKDQEEAEDDSDEEDFDMEEDDEDEEEFEA